MRVIDLSPQLVTKLLAGLTFDDECWLWSRQTNGRYGLVGVGRAGYLLAHRVMWTWFYGPIPDGAWVLHSCDVPACVRPDHLFLGTPKVNTQDMLAKGRHRTNNANKRKTRCKHGHAFTPENTYIRASGERQCRKCKALAVQRCRLGVVEKVT